MPRMRFWSNPSSLVETIIPNLTQQMVWYTEPPENSFLVSALKKKDIRAIHLLAFFPSRAFSAALCASSSDRRLSSSDMNDSSATSAQSFKSGKMDSHVIPLPDASSCLRKISVSLDEWKLWVPRLNRIHLLGMMNACRKFSFNPSMLRRFYNRTYQKVWCTEPSETRKTVWVIG